MYLRNVRTAVKCVAMNNEQACIVGIPRSPAICVVKTDIIPYRQGGHFWEAGA